MLYNGIHHITSGGRRIADNIHMIRKHTISIKHALEGVVWAFSTQPNYRVHCVLSGISILFGLLFHISRGEFLAIGILIIMGLSIETINTAIEETCDAIDGAIRPDIKIAKDVAAGAMLIFAVGSIILAAYIFVPYIITFFI